MRRTPSKELERLLTDSFTESAVEHLHRYAIAAEICVGKDVLDIASGEGYGSHLLARVARQVIGVDASYEVIAEARGKYVESNLVFLEGRADDIPLTNSCVDVVVSFETLEHHDKHEEMLSEIKRVLRPNGVLIISTPDKLIYSDIPNYRNEFHVRELSREEFKSLIERFFRGQRFLSQGSSHGTLIAPEGEWNAFSYYCGNFYVCQSIGRLARHEYNIAIASDGELPRLGVSFFDGMQALQQERQRMAKEKRVGQGKRAQDLKRRLENQDKTIRDLQESLSFRLGRVLTWPLRKLAKRSPQGDDKFASG